MDFLEIVKIGFSLLCQLFVNPSRLLVESNLLTKGFNDLLLIENDLLLMLHNVLMENQFICNVLGTGNHIICI